MWLLDSVLPTAESAVLSRANHCAVLRPTLLLVYLLDVFVSAALLDFRDRELLDVADTFLVNFIHFWKDRSWVLRVWRGIYLLRGNHNGLFKVGWQRISVVVFKQESLKTLVTLFHLIFQGNIFCSYLCRQQWYFGLQNLLAKNHIFSFSRFPCSF